jgi:hypothetical protein
LKYREGWRHLAGSEVKINEVMIYLGGIFIIVGT